jgi:ABC-type sugar transport system ATPase subunit
MTPALSTERADPGSASAVLLEVTGVSKTFPGLRALDQVSLSVAAGEIVALVGQNGSGKSTLVKVLAGLYDPDPGASITDGAGGEPNLRFIHQDLGLVPSLSTIENLTIGRRLGRTGLAPFRKGREFAEATAAVARFGGSFDVRRPLQELAASERAIVAITRAMDGWSRPDGVLILDEPTAALPDSEVDRLFAAVRSVAAAGAGVVFISHHLDEVMDLSDRVVALRGGRVVADLPVAEVDHERLVSLIVGRAVEKVDISHKSQPRQTVLSAEGVHADTLHGISLTIGEGEILGVAGLLGSGREELAGVLFGAAPRRAGRVAVDARTLPGGNPAAAIRAGVALVPSDRRAQGAVMTMSVRENLTLPNLSPLRRLFGRLDQGAERREAQRWMGEVELHPPKAEQALTLFSGGNQQKVVLAKWLRLAPRLLLLDEPTQGVDIGAKAAIYELIGQAASRGMAVLVCSSDTKELTILCDRVLVLRQGTIAAELGVGALGEARLTQETIGVHAASPSTTPFV